MKIHRSGATIKRRRRLKPRKPQDNPNNHDCDEDTEDAATSQRRSAPSSATNHGKASRAWAAHAESLARWTLQRLANRTDAWGQYLPVDKRARGKAQTKKGKLTEAILIRHYRGADVSDLIGLHTTSTDNYSCWLAVDVDHHGMPDKVKQRRNRRAAKKLYARAKRLGFQPLLVSSNGQGGYHLILLFDRPAPTPEVYALGRWLTRDWKALGLADAPELFPKQPRFDGASKFGNFLRLPGRHHTLDYYSRVWTGSCWASGKEAIDLILAKKGDSPSRIPAEALQAEAPPQPEAGAAPTIPPDALGQVQQRALALLRTKTAVQGKGGDKTTWWAACALIKDFALDIEQALPVLRAWNATHCQPPWQDCDLQRKLELAAGEPGGRGRLLAGIHGTLASQHRDSATPVAGGTPYCLEVPDFILADWYRVRPCAPPEGPGRPSVTYEVVESLVHAAVIRQRTSAVWIPDLALAQLLWGADRQRWPRRWRRALLRRTGLPGPWRRPCSTACPLYGRSDPHYHLSLRFNDPDQKFGYLATFEVGRDALDVCSYDFANLRSHHPNQEEAARRQALIAEARKSGRLCSIYLPAWLFGPVALPNGPCRILKAMTRELTRGHLSARPDAAKVFSGKTCPLLDPTQNYVLSGGNGKRGRSQYHGRGYRIQTWMERAAYPTASAKFDWAAARRFLGDLQILGTKLDLIAGGYRTDVGEWQPLERLIEMTQSLVGRQWLAKCLLRVYAPEDYLVRWRRHFAAALGFSFIPGGMDAVPVVAPKAMAAPTITSALELDAWMRLQGVTNRALAARLGVSVATVGYQRSGTRPWSAKFERLLAHLSMPPKKPSM